MYLIKSAMLWCMFVADLTSYSAAIIAISSVPTYGAKAIYKCDKRE